MPWGKGQIATGGAGEHDVLAATWEGEPGHGPRIGPRPRLLLYASRLSPLPRPVKQDLGETRLGVDPPSADSLHDPGREQQG